MKRTPTLLLCMTLCSSQMPTAPAHDIQSAPPAVDSILTAHQWTLVEMLQKQDNDPATNIMMLMMPCEKDNFIVYSKGSGAATTNTYQVMEGPSKCSVNGDTVIGSGSWRFQASDTALFEKYGGGKEISKKVLFISDEMLRIQFAGEGKRMFTLTYLSEKGRQQEHNQDFLVDESDPAQKVMLFIKDYLQATDHYTLVGKNDLANGRMPMSSTGGNTRRTVALIAFAESKDSSSMPARNDALIARADAAGVDYVITGLVDEVKSEKDKADFLGTVKFQVHLLDIKEHLKNAQTFNGSKKTDSKANVLKPKSKGIWKIVNVVRQQVGKGAEWAGQSAALRNTRLGNALTTCAFLNAVTTNLIVSNINFFSPINGNLRQNHYDSTTALVGAVETTREELRGFLAKNLREP